MRQSRSGSYRNPGRSYLGPSFILLCFSLLVVLVAATAALIRAEAVQDIPVGAQWRYFKGTQEPPSGWTAIDFDDSGWPSGPSGFGYGDGDDATVLEDMQGNYLTVYLRHTFSVADPMLVMRLNLLVDYDDAFVAYLNGMEVARANVIGFPPAYNTPATRDHEASAGDIDPQPVQRFDLSRYAGLLRPGANVLAVQGHNTELASLDFSLIPSLEVFKAPRSAVLFQVPAGETWHYLKGVTGPPVGWNQLGFDDFGWPSGPSGFGYSDGDDATVLEDMRGNYRTVYARRTFAVEDPASVGRLFFYIDYDDGFVAYLNGVEVARANVDGQPTAYNTLANKDHEASTGDTDPQPPARFDVSAFTTLLIPGSNVLAVQGHNVQLNSSDFSLTPALLGTSPFSLPATLVRHPYLQLPTPDGITIVWATRESGNPSVRYGLDWTAPEFDDSGWLSGPSGFGYGDGDDATVLEDMQGNYVSVYARRDFTVEVPGAVTGMTLSMDFDDGFVAYLNGVEVARSNVAGVQVAHRATASSHREASGGDTDPQPVDHFDLGPFVHLLRPGDNILAVQGHNVELNSSDFSLVPELTLFTPEAATVIAAGDEWRYFKGVEEPLALTNTATGTSALYSALGGYYQHQVTLEGLLPASRYSYRILVDDVELAAGDRVSLPTAPATPHFTFVAFGDSGTGSANQLAVRDQLQKDRFDLVVMTGDVSQERGQYAELQRTFFDVYRELLKHVPFVPTTGNHDYLTESAQPFMDMFVLPRNGTPGLEERYFSFDYGNVHFVALDTERIGPTQAEWLERDLEVNRQFWTIVYFHRSPFGEGSNHPITESGASQVRARFVPVFEKYGVDLVLAGHNPMYGRSLHLLGGQPDSPYAHAPIDNGIVDYGVVYVTTGGGGDSLARAYTDRFFQAPGATFSAYHYTRVSIADCLLALQAIDQGGNVRDTFSMDRC